MATLFGLPYSRAELLSKVGDIDQICGISLQQLKEGRAQGVEVANIWTGSGLEFCVNLSRGMGIGSFRYKGIPFGWISGTGDVAPWYYEPSGGGLDRSYAGGLMHLSGLRQVGAPCHDEGENLGLHGRICNIPAEKVLADGYWCGDEYVVYLQGKLREASALGENLILSRSITAKLGRSELIIQDKVLNAGNKATPLMILYHTNFGFPLIDEESQLIIPADEVIDGFTGAVVPVEAYSRYGPPIENSAQHIYFHNTREKQDWSGYILANKKLGIGLKVDYLKKNLPQLVNWINLEKGHYVVEVGPSNCKCFGRAAEREAGTLEFLEPGEVREYEIRFNVLDGADEIMKAESILMKQ